MVDLHHNATTRRHVSPPLRLLLLDDRGCHFGKTVCIEFGRRRGGYAGEAAACQPADLVRAVWEPFAPDVPVTHDLSAQLLVFASAITGRLPWISTLRVARIAWDSDLAHRPGDILAVRNLNDPIAQAEGAPPLRLAVREVLLVASLVNGMVSSQDVCEWASNTSSGVDALGLCLATWWRVARCKPCWR